MNRTEILQSINAGNTRRAEIRKAVDRILKRPNEIDRLRGAFNLWLAVNPKIDVTYNDGARAKVTARVAYAQTIEKINYMKQFAEKDDGRRDKFWARNRTIDNDVNWRTLMEFPPGSLEFMRMFAMNMFTGENSNERGSAQNTQKNAIKSMAKVFPEFVVPRNRSTV